MSEKEKKVLSIVNLYYSNPKVQEILFSFSADREVVPRYLNGGFGKRPDALQYPSDIIGLVRKGATSFHCSEEIWQDPLQISSDMDGEELSQIRKSWDLLIDIDSPFLDYSRIAAKLLIEELEKSGIKNYAIKFSGSKGFHIIVPAKAFPENFEGVETRLMFPEWPRAISEYLLYKIRPRYNQIVTQSGINFDALKTRTGLSKEDVVQIACPNCSQPVEKTKRVHFKCSTCGGIQIRPNYKLTKKKLKCVDERCPGIYEVTKEEDYFHCKSCGTKRALSAEDEQKMSGGSTIKKERTGQEYSANFAEEVSAEKIASLDLVLVASRHLFRMPYSLHEKTALASVVITKDEIDKFSPKDANPLAVRFLPFYPDSVQGEATQLLSSALAWKKINDAEYESEIKRKYSSPEFKEMDLTGVTEEMFPKPIKKLLLGLKEGKKRGLFVLITFLRSLNFSAEYINTKVREWNKKNQPPLKEGYVKGQIEWHLRQKKKILPPNYSNQSFYKDLNLIDKMPEAKNPISEVLRELRNTR